MRTMRNSGKSFPSIIVVRTDYGQLTCDQEPFESLADQLAFDRHGLADMTSPAAVHLLELATQEMKSRYERA